MKYVLLLIFVAAVFFGCQDGEGHIVKVAGKAQGTTYHISWLATNDDNYKAPIDSLLKKIDSSLSTYLPTSIISRINQNDSTVQVDKYFTDVFTRAMEIAANTEGLFDVTVAPVINAWGFGFTKKARVDSNLIDSLLQYVGYKKVLLKEGKLVKERPQVQLDFNAIAQGYTVDLLASLLETRGITNYLVELGGEVKAKGKKNKQEYWKVGIDQPNEYSTGERPLQAVITLENKALATSGNYRKFYEENGNKYAHIIHPATGYPARHHLLSATVIANDCMTADAYATAFMVMGMEKAKQFIAANPSLDLEVFFIYDDKGVWKTYSSGKLKEWITNIN